MSFAKFEFNKVRVAGASERLLLFYSEQKPVSQMKNLLNEFLFLEKGSQLLHMYRINR